MKKRALVYETKFGYVKATCPASRGSFVVSMLFYCATGIRIACMGGRLRPKLQSLKIINNLYKLSYR